MQILGLQPRISKKNFNHYTYQFFSHSTGQNNFGNKISIFQLFLFFRPIPEDDDFIWGAIEADFDSGKYKVRDDSPNDKLFPLRVRLQEDRIMGIEKRFFCDRTTEKTVHLEVSDLQRC